MTLRVGVLSLQGAVSEHVDALRKALDEAGLAGEVLTVKRAPEIELLDGLVIPGGESTVIGRLAQKFGFIEKIREAAKRELCIFGTCAGMVLLAKEVSDAKLGEVSQPLLELMDVKVLRNAFGRQRESFEVDINVSGIEGGSFRAVFIRPPIVERVLSKEVKVMATYEGKIVAVQQGKMIATAFHPELSGDVRFHRHFLNTILKTP
jgi:5'-phosphate synthase pdxT subunit